MIKVVIEFMRLTPIYYNEKHIICNGNDSNYYHNSQFYDNQVNKYYVFNFARHLLRFLLLGW